MITESELLDAIKAERDSLASIEGFTIRELSEVTGWGKQRLRDAIRPLVERGVIEVVKVRRPVMGGMQMSMIWAYRLVKKTKKR